MTGIMLCQLQSRRIDDFATIIQALVVTCKGKAADIDPLPLPLQERFNVLLEETRSVLASGVRLCASAGVTSVGGDDTDSVGIIVGSGHPALTVTFLADLEGTFDTETGVDVVNEDLCRFVRASIV